MIPPLVVPRVYEQQLTVQAFLDAKTAHLRRRCELLTSQVEQRRAIAERLCAWLQQSQRAMRIELLQLDGYPPMTVGLVEQRRAGLEKALGDLEREERSLVRESWKDIIPLEAELLRAQVELESQQQRSAVVPYG